MEEGMAVLRELAATGEVGIVIIDSVAAMVTARELEAATGSHGTIAEKARLMAQLLRQLGPEIASSGTCVVFLNHVRDVLDTSPIGQRLAAQGVERKTTPGGTALKYHASLRMHFKTVGRISQGSGDGREAVGSRVQVVVEKNKVGPPYRKVELRLWYGRGFDPWWSLFRVMMLSGEIVRSGGWYECPLAGWKVKGEEAAIVELSQDLTFAEEATERARRWLAERSVIEASEGES
jgi:recombination protein RecA